MSQEQRMKVKAQNLFRKVKRDMGVTAADSCSVGELSSHHSGRSRRASCHHHHHHQQHHPPNVVHRRHHSSGRSGGGDDNGKDSDDDDDLDNDFVAPPVNPQYRLAATTTMGQRRTWAGKLVAYLCGSAVCGGSSEGIGINQSQRLASSLHWMFRANFILLFAVMCAIFFVWVMIFAGFIVAAGRMDPKCVRVGGETFDTATSQFADAFALSWTTFSTVGYGSTYPALGHENDNPTNCLFITFICSLESFLGVLYSGFCGAILFGKVLRIQSHAQVVFSDPIVIRYGSGVQQLGSGTGTDTSRTGWDEEENVGKRIPCPVLEFRVVNRLFGEVGGEIMDAMLNVVANIDANDADPGVRDAMDTDRQQTGRNRTYSSATSTGGIRAGILGGRNNNRDSQSSQPQQTQQPGASTIDSMSDNHSDSGRMSLDSRGTAGTLGTFFFDSLLRRQHQAVDEDPSARLVNKRIFSKMVIEAGEHPFFKRVWLGRHVLDETSPILKPKVRRQVRRNGGYWPQRLNNYEAVRESLNFNQILVSLNGVSNVSASDVYAQKIYDFVDINVGYQFVNVLYKDESSGILKVDTDLINDVREQKGGGGEPLILGE